MISARLATLGDLQTVYGARDLYLLDEIVVVNSHNRGVSSMPRPGG